MTEENVARLMSEYRENVVALFDNKSSDIADNSSYRHAAVLIEEMIKHAKSTFYAFAGRMNPTVWNGTVMTALSEAQAKGVEIKLVVEDICEPIVNGSMPESIRSCVRKMDPEMIDKLRKNLAHCASGDSESLRIETNPEQKSAIFSANNPDMAKTVTTVISDLYRLGMAYDDVA